MDRTAIFTLSFLAVLAISLLVAWKTGKRAEKEVVEHGRDGELPSG